MKQARDQFGRIVDEARAHEPVVVTKHGRPVAAVIDYDQWRRLTELAEDALDIEAYDAAQADPAPSIPWEDVKAELGL